MVLRRAGDFRPWRPCESCSTIENTTANEAVSEELAVQVLTVTVNPALDVSVTVDALVPEHKLMATEHRRDPGGGGVNVARALQHFGVPATALVAAGGPVGAELVDLLRRAGVDTVVHATNENCRESIAVLDASRALQYRVVLPGAPMPDTRALEAAIVTAAATADLVVFSGRLAPGMGAGFFRDVIDRLDEPFVVVDCPGAELAAVVEGTATLVKPSRRELASLVEWTPADEAEIELAARQVLERGSVEALAVSLGARGALLVPRDEPAVWYIPPPVTHIESTVGAGDAMVAGIVAGLTEGRALADAVRFGVACGTGTTATAGTTFCTHAEARALEPNVQARVGSPTTDGARP